MVNGCRSRQSIFVFVPPFCVPPLQKQDVGEVCVKVGLTWVQSDGAMKVLLGSIRVPGRSMGSASGIQYLCFGIRRGVFQRPGVGGNSIDWVGKLPKQYAK